MKRVNDPQQKWLFDPFDSYISAKGKKHLLNGWQGVFRHIILKLMPVDTLGERFSEHMGAPTKELYSMAGLLVIKEFENWTTRETAEAYMFRMDIQYALNLPSTMQTIDTRTIERYQKIFIENDLAAQIMHNVTMCLAQKLEIDLHKQRVDSTHIFSDMAIFGRTRLMGVAIKRFLTQVKRHNMKSYIVLPEELRKRYEPSTHQMFADVKKDKRSYRLLRQQVAEDMHYLVGRFEADDAWIKRNTYQMMIRIFNEQCEVVGDKIEVRKNTGGNVIQNSSDPDATYDGHKGSGYQVQLSETCSDDNEVQLITSAIPQTAAEHDSDAIDNVIEDLKKNETVPEQLIADTAYCGDNNVEKAAKKGIELVGPVAGALPQTVEDISKEEQVYQLNIDDFNVDEQNETIVRCPAGHETESSAHDRETSKTITIMPSSACTGCAYQQECPVQKVQGQFRIIHTPKDRRLASRRREEETDVFRSRYRIRGGIEGTNSGIKRRTGMSRLRVRGRPSVFNTILLKVTGWNIIRASASSRLQAIVTSKAALSDQNRGFGLSVAPIFTISGSRSPFGAGRMVQPPFLVFSDICLAA